MASRREQKEALRRERERREEEQRQAQARSRLWHRAAIGVVVVIAAGLITVAVVSGGGGSGGQTANHDQMDHSSQMSNGAAPGQHAPAFAVLDVTSGRKMTLADLRGKKSLMFFSEGVNCQACMVQAADLQKSSELKKKGIRLVSVTTDSPSVLRQAAGQYGIKTPLLSDQSRKMMGDWGQLGNGGMGHPDTGGHSFVLVAANGKVVWENSYGEMYVPTSKLLKDMHA